MKARVGTSPIAKCHLHVAWLFAIAVLALSSPAAQAQGASFFDTVGITTAQTRGNGQIYGSPEYSLPAEEMPASRSVASPESDARDNVPLRMPDTSGNQPNLASFAGQSLALSGSDVGAYAKAHFFGTTADGGPAGGNFIFQYRDGTTESVVIEFPDWCANPDQSDALHNAIGPLTKRWTRTGENGARCSIYHAAVDLDAAKTVRSVKLPANTSAPAPTQAYLMALTLQSADGKFRMPDLGGRVGVHGDQGAPSTAIAFDPAAPNGREGWHAGATSFTLTAADAEGASIDSTEYRIDGGQVRNYVGPVALPDGEHRIEYRSTDANENVEEFKWQTIKVDANAPATSAQMTPRAPARGDGYYDEKVTIELTARDGDGSGVARTEYSRNGADWTAYSGPIEVGEAGNHTLKFRSSDRAGNVADAGALAFKLDATAPRTTAQINGAAPTSEPYTGAVRVTFTRDDGQGSGVAATEYRIGDGEWTEYRGAFDISALGAHRLSYRSRDAVGNVENFKELWIAIARAPGEVGGPGADGAPGAAGAPGPAGPDMPPPLPDDPIAPPARAEVTIEGVIARSKATVARFARGLIKVRIGCAGVNGGIIAARVRGSDATRLGRREIVARTVACREGRETVLLEPSAAVARSLRRKVIERKRSLMLLITLDMSGTAGAAADKRSVRLKK